MRTQGCTSTPARASAASQAHLWKLLHAQMLSNNRQCLLCICASGGVQVHCMSLHCTRTRAHTHAPDTGSGLSSLWWWWWCWCRASFCSSGSRNGEAMFGLLRACLQSPPSLFHGCGRLCCALSHPLHLSSLCVACALLFFVTGTACNCERNCLNLKLQSQQLRIQKRCESTSLSGSH